MKQEIGNALDSLASDEGILILADSYGSTPFNIATEFIDQTKSKLVSGLNLPMLIRIMNYRLLPLDELKNIAIEGGRRGITTI
jgi:PTS system ascorbate-specific IIA component